VEKSNMGPSWVPARRQTSSGSDTRRTDKYRDIAYSLDEEDDGAARL
jgi:hypothetical protein